MYSRIRIIGFAMAMLLLASSCSKEEIQPTEETSFFETLGKPESINQVDIDTAIIEGSEEEETEGGIEETEELEELKDKKNNSESSTVDTPEIFNGTSKF